MSFNSHQRGAPGVELTASMSGSFTSIGTLLHTPTIIIFDNQGTVPVEISMDGGATTWRTFVAGQNLILDMAQCGYPFSKGMTIYGNGASGTFSISYTYSSFQGN